MRSFCVKRLLFSSTDVKILEALSRSRVSSGLNDVWHPAPQRCLVSPSPPRRGAKTRAFAKVKDLPQGIISTEPLADLEADDAPQYPAVVQGAKNNMIKFKDCVVLTRVGNFYEVLHTAIITLDLV